MKTIKIKANQTLRVGDAARALGVSRNTLRNWDRSGKLPVRRHPKNGYRIYHIDDVKKVVHERDSASATDATPPNSWEESHLENPETPVIGNLSAGSFKRVIYRLNRIFRDSSGGGVLERFEEITKLLFCKLLDERKPPGTPSAFDSECGIRQFETNKRLTALYDSARSKFPSLFSGARGRIPQDWEAVKQSVALLSEVRLSGFSGDIKGAAYEELIRDTFEKDTNQQFFTPRLIVNFMLDLAGPNGNHTLCDPACGSGGFLIGASQRMRISTQSSTGKCHVVGAEIDARMAWVSQMNLLMHAEGVGKIHWLPGGGSLSLSPEAKRALPNNSFDMILTNPPFGSDFTDRPTLDQYAVGRGKTSRRRGIVFLERCVDLLKPGGRLAIIIDDSVLSGPANEDIRRHILNRATIEAVISLPEVTFMPYASVKASILMLRKHAPQSKADPQGNVFMAIAEQVGHRPNGDPLFTEERDPSGHPLLANDLPEILRLWQEFRRSGRVVSVGESAKAFLADADSFGTAAIASNSARFDVAFHHPSRQMAEQTLKRAKFPTPRLGELVEIRSVSIAPSIAHPDETCRYMGLAQISPKTGDFDVINMRGDRIKSAVRLFRGGDIVFAKLRPELRKCAYIPLDEPEGFVSSECVVLRPKNYSNDGPDGISVADTRHEGIEADPAYLAFILRSDVVFGQLIFQSTGVGRPRVSSTAILNVRIPLPPLYMQSRLVARFKSKMTRAQEFRQEAMRLREAAGEAIAVAYRDVEQQLCA